MLIYWYIKRPFALSIGLKITPSGRCVTIGYWSRMFKLWPHHVLSLATSLSPPPPTTTTTNALMAFVVIKGYVFFLYLFIHH